MPKFPIDAPKAKVVGALEALGFSVVRDAEHVSMVRHNPDGTRTPLTMPNHRRLKASTYSHTVIGSGISAPSSLRPSR